MRAHPRDERAASVTVNYTLSLIIVTLLISGLFLSTSGFLETERKRAARSEFEVLGNRVAADIAAVDRLARTAGDAGEVRIRTTIPQTVAGSDYEVHVTSTDQGDYYAVDVNFNATDFDVERTISVRTHFEVVDSSLTGGSYVVVFDGSTLEVQSDA